MTIWTALVVIAAIVAFASTRMAKYRANGRSDERLMQDEGRTSSELQREVEDLRERIAVLERIATDERHSRAIAQEIEELRDR